MVNQSISIVMISRKYVHYIICLPLMTAFLLLSMGLRAESTCYGTTSNGHLENGKQLPSSGDNFVSYSLLGNMMGRTYVHSDVWNIIVDSYHALEESHPGKIYKYAETGHKEGGDFSPHKTHRNGLSVDFMVPVMNTKGASELFGTNPLNRFGYDVEFNAKGELGDQSIDFDAMAAHIIAVHKEAKSRGHDIWRVIFDPKLQPMLFAARGGEYLQDNITFLKKRSWVRHDEHYHIDFAIPCLP
jgi:penicillin-insensitive murein endopeptidase